MDDDQQTPSNLTPLQQQWFDEVQYLHSLWHIGPPPSSYPNPTKKPKLHAISNNPNPPPQPLPHHPYPVQQPLAHHPYPVQQPLPHLPYPVQQPLPHSHISASSDEETQDDSQESDKNVTKEEEGDNAKMTQEYAFFLRLFKEDNELTSYYEMNCCNGWFCCLVCWGNNHNVNKRFQNCVSLLAHSTTTYKTKRAHRVFAQLLCNLLAWDLNDFATIVSSQEPLKGDDYNDSNKDLNKEKAKCSAFQVQYKGLKASKEFFSGIRGLVTNDNVQNKDLAEEQVTFAAVHQKGLKASEEYFLRNRGIEEGERENDLMFNDEKNVFDFFLGIFNDDQVLRDYYLKKCEDGDFCCLVCWGHKQKLTKKFKNCSALVQHSLTISNNKLKKAHQAFGQVINRVLGRDITQIVGIVPSANESLVCISGQLNSQS